MDRWLDNTNAALVDYFDEVDSSADVFAICDDREEDDVNL